MNILTEYLEKLKYIPKENIYVFQEGDSNRYLKRYTAEYLYTTGSKIDIYNIWEEDQLLLERTSDAVVYLCTMELESIFYVL